MSDTPPQKRNIHRRTKQEIPGLYVCGDPVCAKSYGTNAALYTHIKNKHGGVEPPGTTRPSLTVTKGKKGRPVADESSEHSNNYVSSHAHLQDNNLTDPSSLVCMICGRHDECICPESYDAEYIKIFSDSYFVNFLKYVGAFGEDNVKQTNFWVRNVDSELASISEDYLRKFIADFQMDYRVKPRVSEKLFKVLLYSSKFWAAPRTEELYKGILVMVSLQSTKAVCEFLKKRPELKNFVEHTTLNPSSFETLFNILNGI